MRARLRLAQLATDVGSARVTFAEGAFGYQRTRPDGSICAEVWYFSNSESLDCAYTSLHGAAELPQVRRSSNGLFRVHFTAQRADAVESLADCVHATAAEE